ncbi:uncharacterized protein BX664DRAFT_322516 [Halteromyces radiatus]|uniref:uncharacterized protein n=1 Tax=Halteromyces radiatus TaxID=101107 RepID=UPI00221F529C|nr:uncharacterized protein BX664DRAFT_322516 [Halteromyces radiatus]KAI8099962.1 hypothetical protein BX664DRAFT_322516 [Halteromyces radiatus]
MPRVVFASRHFQQWLYVLFEFLLVLLHSLLCLHLRLSTTTTIEYNFLKCTHRLEEHFVLFYLIYVYYFTHDY